MTIRIPACAALAMLALAPMALAQTQAPSDSRNAVPAPSAIPGNNTMPGTSATQGNTVRPGGATTPGNAITGNTVRPGNATMGNATGNNTVGNMTGNAVRSGNTTAGPVPGANSFTEGQARSRIESAGFSGVSELTQDQNGVWRGRAMRGGQPVQVSLDFQGNVSAQ